MKNKPIIIVEGIDRVGKSTLCSMIAKELDYKIFHDEYSYSNYKKFNNLQSALMIKYAMLAQTLPMIDGVVVDRYHLTEYVYNTLRGQGFSGVNTVDNWLANNKAILILVESEDIERSNLEHGSDLTQHARMFDFMFNWTSIKHKYKTSYSDFDNFVDNFARRLTNG